MAGLLVVADDTTGLMKASSIARAARAHGLACVCLQVGAGGDDELARILLADFERAAAEPLTFVRELVRHEPVAVVVVGDSDDTLACATAARQAGYPVARADAGVRATKRPTPDDTNRSACDHLATYLYTPTRDAGDNLLAEGVDPDQVSFVGNPLVETLARVRHFTPERSTSGYCAVLLRDGGSLDSLGQGADMLEAVVVISRLLPTLLLLDASTKGRLDALGLAELAAREPGVVVADTPHGLELIGLVDGAHLLVTDAADLGELASACGTPCIALDGAPLAPSARLAPMKTEPIVELALTLLERGTRIDRPELWDGRAGQRIAQHLAAALRAHASASVAHTAR